MLFDELMFSESEQLKLELYREITRRHYGLYRIENLAEKFQLTYHQTVNVLTKIDEDLARYVPEKPSVFRKAGIFEVSASTPPMDEYRAIALEDSVPYQYILSILNQKDNDILTFSRRKGVSRSTISRKLSPLVSFFNTFDLSFSHTTMTILGNEKVIRMVLFHLLWVGLRGNKWPFERIEESYTKNTLFPQVGFYNYTGNKIVAQDEMLWILAVCQTRYHSGFVIEENLELETFFETSEFFYYEDIPRKRFKTEREWKNELNFLFFDYFTMSYLYPRTSVELREERKRLLECTKYQWCLPVVRRLILYLTSQQMIRLDSAEDLSVFQSECMRQILRLCEYGRTISSIELLEYSGRAKTDGMKKVEKHLTQFFREICSMEYPHFYQRTICTQFVSSFATLVYYESAKKRRDETTITVALAVEETFLYTQFVMYLKELRMVKVVDFRPSDCQKYDLVVYGPTFLKKKYAATSYFQVEFNYDNEDLDNLGRIIHEKYWARIMN